MQYRINPKNGQELSLLGFGCMRLAQNDEQARALITRAIEQGVNYFDTAYYYAGNEALLGRALSGGYRERINIATKLMPRTVRTYADFDRVLFEQLKRLQTTYIDYYLIHMLTSKSMWERLVALGIETWLAEKKQAGSIRNIGFSYHGGLQEFQTILDCRDWDMCLLQYNYLDEHRQAGRAGVEYAAGKGMPVMIMEPLRGGRLVNHLPKEAAALFEKTGRSPAEWGLRWVYDHPAVTVVLSGMTDLAMLDENIRTASTTTPLTAEDRALFANVKAALDQSIKVPCTGCSYCIPCPAGVDIPNCFSNYNDLSLDKKSVVVRKYMMQTCFKRPPANASNCTGCGACEAKCPQGIAIREELKNAAKALEGPFFKTVTRAARRVMKT